MYGVMGPTVSHAYHVYRKQGHHIEMKMWTRWCYFKCNLIYLGIYGFYTCSQNLYLAMCPLQGSPCHVIYWLHGIPRKYFSYRLILPKVNKWIQCWISYKAEKCLCPAKTPEESRNGMLFMFFSFWLPQFWQIFRRPINIL